jgi:hypothetical protein
MCWCALLASAEYSDTTSSTGGEQSDTLHRHIEKMRKLELELDKDLTMLGMSYRQRTHAAAFLNLQYVFRI